MGKTRDLFKKIRDTKGTFHAKMGSIKDRNGMDLTEAEDIKKRWQEYTEELYKRDLHNPDSHDGVITHLEPDILEGEVNLCSRVATGISWSSLGGLKGVKPPEAFGERSRDWSLGHAGDEGPHLSMTGESRVVLERRPQCAVSHEVRRRGQLASRGAPGKSGLHASGEGERLIALEPW